jgi:hypothetical protein
MLTASEKKILETLAAATGPSFDCDGDDVRKAAKLSRRGFRIVWNRMVDRNLVGWSERQKATITFGGIRELKASA